MESTRALTGNSSALSDPPTSRYLNHTKSSWAKVKGNDPLLLELRSSSRSGIQVGGNGGSSRISLGRSDQRISPRRGSNQRSSLGGNLNPLPPSYAEVERQGPARACSKEFDRGPPNTILSSVPTLNGQERNFDEIGTVESLHQGDSSCDIQLGTVHSIQSSEPDEGMTQVKKSSSPAFSDSEDSKPELETESYSHVEKAIPLGGNSVISTGGISTTGSSSASQLATSDSKRSPHRRQMLCNPKGEKFVLREGRQPRKKDEIPVSGLVALIHK